MSLRIRRGTNSQRTGITFDLGEIVYTTDTQKLYIGDGVTAGGKHVLETSVGNGFTFNPTTQQVDFAIGNLFLTTTQVTEGSNQYFTTERAQDAVGAALVAGNSFNTGITFTYDDANNRITAISTGGATTTVSSDTNPSLGGNLSLNGFNISGSGNISATSLSSTTLTATNLGGNLAAGSYNITGVGNLGATTITAANLGGSLNAASYNITGVGNLSSTNLTATNLVGNLNIGTNSITGTGSITADTINVTNLGRSVNVNSYNLNNIGSISATTLTATNLGGSLNAASYNITGVGSLGATTITATNLGGNLAAGSYNITGVGRLGATSVSTLSISGSSTGINLTADGSTPLSVTGIGTLGPTSGQVYLNINAAKGTIASPTTSAAGDGLGGVAIQGYNGTTFKMASLIVSSWDASATLSDTFPKSKLTLITGGGGSTLRQASLDNQGVFTAPILKAGSYSTTDMNAIVSPSAGMIIFNTTDNDFYGYNGSTWVAFTGP